LHAAGFHTGDCDISLFTSAAVPYPGSSGILTSDTVPSLFTVKVISTLYNPGGEPLSAGTCGCNDF